MFLTGVYKGFFRGFQKGPNTVRRPSQKTLRRTLIQITAHLLSFGAWGFGKGLGFGVQGLVS